MEIENLSTVKKINDGITHYLIDEEYEALHLELGKKLLDIIHKKVHLTEEDYHECVTIIDPADRMHI